jgi:hypothetical protein
MLLAGIHIKKTSQSDPNPIGLLTRQGVHSTNYANLLVIAHPFQTAILFCVSDAKQFFSALTH